MSVILDALRKLDREKSSRRKKTAEIAVEILKSDATHPGGRFSMYILIVAGAAIAASAITYSVMLKFGYLSKLSPPVSQTVASDHRVAPASPDSAVPSKFSSSATLNPPSPLSKTAPASSQQVVPAPAETAVPSKSSPATVNPPSASKNIPALAAPAPVRNAREEMSQELPKVQKPTEKKDRIDAKIPIGTKTPAESKTTAESKTQAAPIVEKKGSQAAVSKELHTTPQKTAEPTPNIAPANPASFKLSAIAWYEDPSMRFAMINGIMAREGSSIEGVKVVEINPTSVRLLHDGQYFEISMSK